MFVDFSARSTHKACFHIESHPETILGSDGDDDDGDGDDDDDDDDDEGQAGPTKNGARRRPWQPPREALLGYFRGFILAWRLGSVAFAQGPYTGFVSMEDGNCGGHSGYVGCVPSPALPSTRAPRARKGSGGFGNHVHSALALPVRWIVMRFSK